MKNNSSESNVLKPIVKTIIAAITWEVIETKLNIDDRSLVNLRELYNIHSIKIKDIIKKYNKYVNIVNKTGNFNAITLYKKAYEKINLLENPESINEFISSLYHASFYIEEALANLRGK